MSNWRSTTATVTNVARIGTSEFGNPRYELTTAQGDKYRTKADAGCAYVVSPGPTNKRYTLTLDGRGSVIGIKEDD